MTPSPVLGTLEQGWCGEDDFVWRSQIEVEDGNLYLWVKGRNAPALPLQPFQIALLEQTVTHWQALKRVAVAYVRGRIRTNPGEYGLNPNERRNDGGPDWLQADLAEYLQDFKLRQVGVPQQAQDEQVVFLAFETHMDLEHGCAVELAAGQPVREGMWAEFGSMLILESEAYPVPS